MDKVMTDERKRLRRRWLNCSKNKKEDGWIGRKDF